MKTIFAAFISIGIIGTCLGQGTVNWSTISPAAMTAQTNLIQYSPFGFLQGTSPFGGSIGNTSPANTGLKYYYELLYNTSFTGTQAPVPGPTELFNGTWLDTGLTATNANAAGLLVPVNPSSASVVPWANGTTNNIMIVGWSANLGTSWLAVSNELVTGLWFVVAGSQFPFFGESATGYLNPNSIGPGASIFGSFAGGINSPNTQLYFLAEPEPSTFALTGLSALCLFLFRRQRR